MVISQTTNMHLILHNSDWLHVFYYLHQIQSTHRVINFNYKLYQPSSPICLCFYKERNIMPYRKNNQFSSTSCKSNSRNTRYWSIYNIWYFFQKLFIKWIVSHVHGFSTLNRFYKEMLYTYLTMLSIPSNYESRIVKKYFLFLYFFIKR